MKDCPFCYTEGCPAALIREVGENRISNATFITALQVCALNRIATNLVSIRAIMNDLRADTVTGRERR